MSKRKILIIDDSAFTRKVLSTIIEEDGRLEVIGTAKNGKEGMEMALALSPDVISVDIEMPIMNGLTMIKELMAKKSFPIVVVSSLSKEGAKETIQALEYGAFDFIAKPSSIFGLKTDEVFAEYIEKVYAAAMSKNKISSRAESKAAKTSYSPQLPVFAKAKEVSKDKVQKPATKLVAIGTSTGGPKALPDVLTQFPEDFPAGIVIVQHMPPGFTKSLANRLDQLSTIQVKEAEDGELIVAGTAYIAPGDRHLTVIEKNGKYYVALDDGPKKGPHKPSVDVMMSSLSKLPSKKMIAVIMTGMGNDGCEGIEELKKANDTYTIAQDEASCVVYGMPRAVVQKHLSDETVPLNQIAQAIKKKLEVL